MTGAPCTRSIISAGKTEALTTRGLVLVTGIGSEIGRGFLPKRARLAYRLGVAKRLRAVRPPVQSAIGMIAFTDRLWVLRSKSALPPMLRNRSRMRARDIPRALEL